MLAAMLVCHGCHRHVRVSETECPFCGTDIDTMPAPAPLKVGAMALIVGLSMFGCSDDGGDDTTTTMTSP